MSTPGGMKGPAEPLPPPEDECERYVHERLQNYRRDSIPVSRFYLASLLAKAKRMRHKYASEVVDRYCDERAPAIPDYLGKEFMVPYMKMISLLPGAMSILVVIVTVVRFRISDPSFRNGLLLAAGLLVLGILTYLRSLYREFGAED